LLVSRGKQWVSSLIVVNVSEESKSPIHSAAEPMADIGTCKLAWEDGFVRASRYDAQHVNDAFWIMP
jgi:hypothetical protein